MMQFVKVSNRILDEKNYISEIMWLKYETKRKLITLLDKEYIKIEDFEKSYYHFKVKLHNEKLDTYIDMEFYRNKKPSMV